MTNHTRRQFLGFIASLLTLIDAVRRFFKPPEVVVDPKTQLLRGGCRKGKTLTEWPEPNTGPYFDYYEDEGAKRWIARRSVMSKADAERIYGLKPGTLD